MTNPAIPDSVTELLLGCDPMPASGWDPLVQLSLEQGEVIVVSDLHLAAGLGKNQTYARTENFFALGAFHRFLADRMNVARPHSTLVINGDLVDFVRVMNVPGNDGEFQTWSDILRRVGIRKSVRELKDSITGWRPFLRIRLRPGEKLHGLKTNDYKSVWKLCAAVNGHQAVFTSLAEWMGAGHRIVVVKGNHDLEWYWPAVRNYLRLVLAEKLIEARLRTRLGPSVSPADFANALATELKANTTPCLQADIIPRLRFVDDAAVVDDQLFIEHGHRYDKFTWPVGGPTFGKNKNELNLPFGSFFNRYLINHVELDYPYVDNIRPAQNIVPLLIREHFPTALRLFFEHVPFTLRVIPKRYYRYIFGQTLVLGLAILVPVAATVVLLWREFSAALAGVQTAGASLPVVGRFVWNEGLRLVGGLGGLVMSYLFARIVAALQLKAPGDLTPHGEKRLKQNAGLRFVVFGHTHNPAQAEFEGRWVYNAGTWIPVIELSTAEVRHDRTFTFVHLKRGRDGSLESGVVERWVDEAGRAEPMVILERRR